MIDVKNLSVYTKVGRCLLNNVNFTINDGDKLAIIGEEGNGKTTLMKAMLNILPTQEFVLTGNVNLNNATIGYLEQTLDKGWLDCTISDYFLKSEPNAEPNYYMYERFDEIAQLLSHLGVEDRVFSLNQDIKTMSGGEKIKMQMAKILLQKPDVLFLDEPTNDLDIETLEWLEKFISASRMGILFVSHDETLLENTATSILHIEQLKKKTESKVTFKKNMGYRQYIMERGLLLEKQDQVALFEKKQRSEQLQITNDMKNKIQQQNPGRPNSMRAVIARENRWERDTISAFSDSEDSIKIKFIQDQSVPKSKRVLDYNLKELKIEDKTLSKDINLSIYGPEKIVITGKNGVGKTTLLKNIYKTLIDDGIGLKVEYMPQNYDELLRGSCVALDYLMDGKNNSEQTIVRTCMGSLKFTNDEMMSPIERLSGGQKAKLFLLHMILNKNNVLVLDEPTRNLSPLSNPVIRKLLKEYNGAIISVSHDRKFISEVCDQQYILTNKGLLVVKKTIENEITNDK